MSLDEWIPAAEARARGYDPVSIARMEWVEQARAEGQELIAQIELAFEGVPRPRITLTVARGLDDEYILSEERERELASCDPEQTWQEVSDEAIVGHNEYFTFSDAEGWRFYLPAFLCQYLRLFPCGNDTVVSACESRSHVELLTEEQLQCLDRFEGFRRTYENWP